MTAKEVSETECEHMVMSMELMANHIGNVAKQFDKQSVRDMLAQILDADSIFVMGAGRSGLVGKAFAMRLMHLGFNVYVVGETTTPAVRNNDLVVAISGSGETRSMADLGKIAKEIGSSVVTITSNKDSTLGMMSDAVMVMPGRTKSDAGDGYLERHMRGEYSFLTPLGTSFEITSLVFLDALVAELIAITGSSEADLKRRHTVLE